MTVNQKTIHRCLAGKALIYVGSVGFACCSWEGRPPCRPVPMRESLTGLSALGDSLMFMWFLKCPWSTRRSTLPNRIVSPWSMTKNQIIKDSHTGAQLTQYNRLTYENTSCLCKNPSAMLKRRYANRPDHTQSPYLRKRRPATAVLVTRRGPVFADGFATLRPGRKRITASKASGKSDLASK